MGTGVRATDQAQFNNVFRTSAPVPPLFDMTSDDNYLYASAGFPYFPRISLSTGMVSVVLHLLWNGANINVWLQSIVHVKGWLYVSLREKNCVFGAPVTQSVADAYTYCVTNTPLIQIPSGSHGWHLAVSDNKNFIILSAEQNNAMGGLYRYDFRLNVLTFVVPYIAKFQPLNAHFTGNIDVHGEYVYVSHKFDTAATTRARVDMTLPTATPILEPTHSRSLSATAAKSPSQTLAPSASLTTS
eukprot:PhM_4_TR13309/c2_g2_i8/m.77024